MINIVHKSIARTRTRNGLSPYTHGLSFYVKNIPFNEVGVISQRGLASDQHREVFPFSFSVYTEVYAYTVSAHEEYSGFD